jgi:hypothetical protein
MTLGTQDLYRLGLIFLVLSLVMIGAGLLLSSPISGYFSWFGRLPGDIRIDGDGYRVRVPLVSSILISLILTVIINLMRRR